MHTYVILSLFKNSRTFVSATNILLIALRLRVQETNSGRVVRRIFTPRLRLVSWSRSSICLKDSNVVSVCFEPMPFLHQWQCNAINAIFQSSKMRSKNCRCGPSKHENYRTNQNSKDISRQHAHSSFYVYI